MNTENHFPDDPAEAVEPADELALDPDAEAVAPGVRRGIADFEAGRSTELHEFDREFRAKHGLPPRQSGAEGKSEEEMEF